MNTIKVKNMCVDFEIDIHDILGIIEEKMNNGDYRTKKIIKNWFSKCLFGENASMIAISHIYDLIEYMDNIIDEDIERIKTRW